MGLAIVGLLQPVLDGAQEPVGLDQVLDCVPRQQVERTPSRVASRISGMLTDAGPLRYSACPWLSTSGGLTRYSSRCGRGAPSLSIT